MPRTKINRNAASNKRVRDNSADIEEILRGFDVEIENIILQLTSEHKKNLREIDAKFEELRQSVPAHILSMELSEVRQLEDFNEIIVEEAMTNLNITVKETVQRTDEGYITEARSHLSTDSEACNKSLYKNTLNVGPLKTIKSRRRSQSASGIPSSTFTPGPRALMSTTKGRTPLMQQKQQVPTTHTSRSKYRTPMTGIRQKAISADRLNTITPKANPANPFSMLRHARAGEPVFSVTGSPIVASQIVEQTANVNIPIANGILSIRPQNIDPTNLDTSMINKIDQNTFNHLRTLKANLDILMAGFNQKFHN